MAKKKTHEWTIANERHLIDTIVNKYKNVEWSVLLTQIANDIGTSKASVAAKIQNHRYTLGLGGSMDHTSKLGDQAINEAVEKYGFTRTKWSIILG